MPDSTDRPSEDLAQYHEKLAAEWEERAVQDRRIGYPADAERCRAHARRNLIAADRARQAATEG